MLVPWRTPHLGYELILHPGGLRFFPLVRCTGLEAAHPGGSSGGANKEGAQTWAKVTGANLDKTDVEGLRITGFFVVPSPCLCQVPVQTAGSPRAQAPIRVSKGQITHSANASDVRLLFDLLK